MGTDPFLTGKGGDNPSLLAAQCTRDSARVKWYWNDTGQRVLDAPEYELRNPKDGYGEQILTEVNDLVIL